MKFNLTQVTQILAGLVASAAISSSCLAQDAENVTQTTGFSAQSCPAEFFQMPLYPDAKLCQIFAEQLPASMIYHANADQQSTQSFYQQQLGQPERLVTVKGRIVMEYDNANRIIVISKDGSGSQVDVLVKLEQTV